MVADDAQVQLVLALFAISVLLQPATDPAHVEPRCAPAADGDVIIAAPGSTFAVALRSNAGTGYSWALTDGPDTSVANMLDMTTGPTTSTLPGGPQSTCFVFEAVAPGTTHLDFAYFRPFEPDVPPAQTVAVTLVVAAGARAPVQLP